MEPRHTPKQIVKQARRVKKLFIRLKRLRNCFYHDSSAVANATAAYMNAKSGHRRLFRRTRAIDSYNRDSRLMNDPKTTFASIRRAKRNQSGTIA